MYLQEESFAENPFSLLRNLKKGFVGKYGSFTVSYETLNGFVQNQLSMGFITKQPRVSYKTVKDPYFPTKSLFKFRIEEKGFSAKGSVELKIRFLSILRRFQVYGTFFPGFIRNLFFVRMYTGNNRKVLITFEGRTLGENFFKLLTISVCSTKSDMNE